MTASGTLATDGSKVDVRPKADSWIIKFQEERYPIIGHISLWYRQTFTSTIVNRLGEEIHVLTLFTRFVEYKLD